MRILTIDIENRPALGWIWSIWNQNLSLAQLEQVGETISFAAKWYGERKVYFFSEYHHGKQPMLEAAHAMLSEADVVVGYNSKGFDMKHLNREFLLAGMKPPAPYHNVDLMLEIKKNFRFTSNKLDHIVQQLGIGAKTPHTGWQLWLDCLKGDRKAWSLMKKYNKQDVVITEKLYDELLPWIKSHPAHGLYTPSLLATCTNCGSERIQKRGLVRTTVSVYQQYACMKCGKWMRSGKRVAHVDLRGI